MSVNLDYQTELRDRVLARIRNYRNDFRAQWEGKQPGYVGLNDHEHRLLMEARLNGDAELGIAPDPMFFLMLTSPVLEKKARDRGTAEIDRYWRTVMREDYGMEGNKWPT